MFLFLYWAEIWSWQVCLTQFDLPWDWPSNWRVCVIYYTAQLRELWYLVISLLHCLSYRLDHSTRTFHMRPCLPFYKRWVISSLSASLPSSRLSNVLWHREAHGLSSFCLQRDWSPIVPHDSCSLEAPLQSHGLITHLEPFFYSFTVKEARLRRAEGISLSVLRGNE